MGQQLPLSRSGVRPWQTSRMSGAHMIGLPGNWNEPDSELLDQLTRHGKSSADTAVIGLSGTQSEKTRTAVRSALRMLLANGLITAVPPEDWPAYVILDPPGPEWTRSS